MLHIVLWKWHQPGFRSTYTAEHVNVMFAMLKRHLVKVNYRVVLVTDDPAGVNPEVIVHPLWNDLSDLRNASGKHLPSCYRRLKLFDAATQTEMGIAKGDRIMSVDLDAIVSGDMRHVVQRPERFVGWAVRGMRHLRVFNGSMFLFTAGDLQEVWTEFDPNGSPATAQKNGYFGSDQSWLSYKLAKRHDCAGWGYPQVLSYPRECMRRPILPRNSAIIFFHGKDKPWDEKVQKAAPWVLQYWHDRSKS
jgi:hypothetical protein